MKQLTVAFIACGIVVSIIEPDIIFSKLYMYVK